jgi:hypothetical protein
MAALLSHRTYAFIGMEACVRPISINILFSRSSRRVTVRERTSSVVSFRCFSKLLVKVLCEGGRGGCQKGVLCIRSIGHKGGMKKCCKEQLNGTPGNVSRNCQNL